MTYTLKTCDTISMIIYEATVEQFKKDVDNGRLVSLIINLLLNKYGIRVGKAERRSWNNSLPEVKKILIDHKNDYRKVLCEFNIPTSKKRIDFIILGKNKNNKPSAWILELKQWSKVKEEDWNEFLISGKYKSIHPSYQANDYKNILQQKLNIHDNVDIKSSAFLHNLHDVNSPLFARKYDDILNKAKLYMFSTKDELSKLIDKHTIIKNGEIAFNYFKEAKWKPSESFHEIINKNFRTLTLVGSQKVIYDKIEKYILAREKETSRRRLTFLISGDPGSGKTIIAFKLLHLMMQNKIRNLNGPTQMMIPGQEVRKAFKDELSKNILSSNISGATMWKDYHSVIIDEAHKAIGRDVGSINYDKYIYAKDVELAIIFIDNDQIINKKGITKSEIKEIAEKHGHKVYEYKIEENFRAKGERTLLDWIDHVFYKRPTENGEFKYEQIKYINSVQEYKLFAYKTAKEFTNSYFKYCKTNKKTRISSLWHKGYYLGPPDEKGYPKATFTIGDEPFIWNPNEEWKNQLMKNNARYYKDYHNKIKEYANDRKKFLIGNPPPQFIAYFNHIQGYEFDHIFVYIPNVFTYNVKTKTIDFHRERLAKEVKNSQSWSFTSKAKKIRNKSKEEIYEINKRFFINRIKVMLTRGTKSTHVFAEDKALNEYICSKIE